MKALQIKQYGDHEQLVSLEAPTPAIKNHEILVKVTAASVNPVDYKIRSGAARHVLRYKMPLTLGHDFSGMVAKVGSDVSSFKEGDQVYGRTKRTGTFQQYVVVDEQDICSAPSNMSLVEAAAVPLVGLTAYQGIHQWIKLKAGERILITGASGGVGHVAVQLAKLAGATVVATASDAGTEFLSAYHVDRFIDYRKEAFKDSLNQIDAVFDMRGGRDLEDAFEVVKSGGHIATIAALPTPACAKAAELGKLAEVFLGILSRKKLRLGQAKGITYDAFVTQSNHQQLSALTRFIENGDLHVAIEKILPWTEANEAIELVKQGRVKGKIVVDLSRF